MKLGQRLGKLLLELRDPQAKALGQLLEVHGAALLFVGVSRLAHSRPLVVIRSAQEDNQGEPLNRFEDFCQVVHGSGLLLGGAALKVVNERLNRPNGRIRPVSVDQLSRQMR